MVFVGGVNLLLYLFGFVSFLKVLMLLLCGCCCVFDVIGDGYVCLEGGVFVLLKLFDCVLVDGDMIYVVIVGFGVNLVGYLLGGISVLGVVV